MSSRHLKHLCHDQKKHRCRHSCVGPTGAPGPMGSTGPTGAQGPTGESFLNQGFTLTTSLLDGTIVSGPVTIKNNDTINYRSSRPIIITSGTERTTNAYNVIYASGYQTHGILYVDSQYGSDDPPGYSETRENPAYPFATIQAAIAAANDPAAVGHITTININPGVGYTIDGLIESNVTLSFSDTTNVNVLNAGTFKVANIVALSGNGANFQTTKADSDPPVFNIGEYSSNQNITFNTIGNSTGVATGYCFGLEETKQVPSLITVTCNNVRGFNIVFNLTRISTIITTINFNINFIIACKTLYQQSPGVENTPSPNLNVTFANSDYYSVQDQTNLWVLSGTVNLNNMRFENPFSYRLYNYNPVKPRMFISNCRFNEVHYLRSPAQSPSIDGVLTFSNSQGASTGYVFSAVINPGDGPVTIYYFGNAFQGGSGPFDPNTVIAINIQTT